MIKLPSATGALWTLAIAYVLIVVNDKGYLPGTLAYDARMAASG